MPKVSVIIPAYNHAVYLPDAIDSVLGQTYRDVEILVIDDGSTDDTRRVAAAYGDAIIYIYQENRGLSAARNTGIDSATGQLIGFLDADDFYDPRFLETMVSILDAEEDLAAAYCGFRFVDCAKQPAYQTGSRAVPSERLYQTLLDGNFLAVHCVLARRAMFAQLGSFDESLTACEDWDVWLRLARSATVKGIDEILVYYRMAEGSLSRDPDGMLKHRLLVLEKQLGPVTSDSAEMERRARARAYTATAFEYLQGGAEDRAVECFERAVELYPHLLGELETFYELVLWDQPKGRRGDTGSIDLRTNVARVLEILAILFAGSGLSRFERRQARGTAFLAAGLVAYNSGQISLSRHYLRRAMSAHPQLWANPRAVGTLGKSYLGPTALEQLRRMRAGLAVGG